MKEIFLFHFKEMSENVILLIQQAIVTCQSQFSFRHIIFNIHVYFLLSDNNCTFPAALAEKCRPSASTICSVYSLRVFKWCIFSVLDKGEQCVMVLCGDQYEIKQDQAPPLSTLQYSNKIMGPAHHICTATDKLSNAVKTPRPDTNPFYFEVFKLRNYKRGLHAFIV